MSSIADDLTRATRRIGPVVTDFLRERHAGEHFTAAELAAYVAARDPNVAPGSPCRALRALRCKGAARVKCVDQSAGVYEVVEPPPEPAWRKCERIGHVYGDGSGCVRCGQAVSYQTAMFGEAVE